MNPLNDERVDSLNMFFDSPSIKFSASSCEINGKSVDFSDPELGEKLFKFSDRLACLVKLDEEFGSSKEPGIKMASVPYYSELWTRFLRTLVNDADQYRWTVKLFNDRPSLQVPYFLFESLKNDPEVSESSVGPMLERAKAVVKYCIKAYCLPKSS